MSVQKDDKESETWLRDVISATLQGYQAALQVTSAQVDGSDGTDDRRATADDDGAELRALETSHNAELRALDADHKAQQGALGPAGHRAGRLADIAGDLMIAARTVLADAASAYVKGGGSEKALAQAGSALEPAEVATAFAQAHIAYAEFRVHLLDLVAALTAEDSWQEAMRLLPTLVENPGDTLYPTARAICELLAATIRDHDHAKANLDSAELFLLKTSDTARNSLAPVLAEVEYKLARQANEAKNDLAFVTHLRRLTATKLKGQEVATLSALIRSQVGWHVFGPREVWSIPFKDLSQMQVTDLPSSSTGEGEERESSCCLILLTQTGILEIWNLPEQRRVFATVLPRSYGSSLYDHLNFRYATIWLTRRGDILVLDPNSKMDYAKGFLVMWRSEPARILPIDCDSVQSAQLPCIRLEQGRSMHGTAWIDTTEAGAVDLHIGGQQIDEASWGMKGFMGAISPDETLIALLGADQVIHIFQTGSATGR